MFNKEQQVVADNIKSLLDILPVIGTIERQVFENVSNIELMADTAFLCKKADDILKSIRKRLEELDTKVAHQACIYFEATQQDKYQGDLATISPNPEPYIRFPSSPTDPEFESFVKQLPPHCVRPHYPSVQEEILKRFENGDQAPFGLDRKEIAGMELKIRVTSKRGKDL